MTNSPACASGIEIGCVPTSSCCGSRGCRCLTVVSKANEDVYLTLVSDHATKLLTFKPGSTTQITFPTNATYDFVGASGKVYAQTPDSSVGAVVVGYDDFIRKPLGSAKKFTIFFWIIVVLGLLVGIVGAVMAHKRSGQDAQARCQEDNDSPQECQNLETLQDYKAPVSGFVAASVFGFLVAIIAGVFWFLCFGPGSWTSYSHCKAKKDYGTQWFWVKPRSGFRNFLCSAFGACECAADGAALLCNASSISKTQPYAWDEAKARKSTSKTDLSFCCTSSGACTNPVKSLP